VAKIRSNLHTGQYADGVPSDHGQRQALVEPLPLPGVTRNVNEFFFKTAQEGSSGPEKKQRKKNESRQSKSRTENH